ncbi:hypothetical protein PG994_010536 [Apiospora phragmitis]|uniref:DUF7587 domain-containing protein n=1 Tax=Apiospora phragmitis TaxID=2905665 RepID=A0ABR1TQ57_9PEZI
MSHSSSLVVPPVWGPRETLHDDRTDTKAWVVGYRENRTGRIWATGSKSVQYRDDYSVDSPPSSHHKFKIGAPYKAIPYKGVCARSYPEGPERSVFQIQFEKHMYWSWRGDSPFMSATTSLGKAMHVGEGYHKRGYKDIKILVIDTVGDGWTSEQRVWHVTTLLQDLNTTVEYAREDEYLITHSIPLLHVKTLSWVDLEHKGVQDREDLDLDETQYGTITEPEEGWLQHEQNK